MSRRWMVLILSILSLVCLVAAGLAAAGYFYVQDQAPSRLADSGYYVRRTRVFYYPGFGLREPFVIVGADPDSFVAVDSSYGLDATQVYLDGEPIPGADPATFSVLDSPYARDAHYVYMGKEIFSDDVENFEVVDSFIVRDSRHIYWGGEAISDDPAHLELLGNHDYNIYIRDSQTAFVNGNPIVGADAATFEVIQSAFSRDAVGVFYFDQRIVAADPASFDVLEPPYALDASSVFWKGNVIEGADPTTFRVLNADFECSADNAYAYHQDQPIPGVDAAAIPADSRATNCTATELFLYD